jgi:hypothetical protein
MGSGIMKFAGQGVEYDVVLAAVLVAVWVSATKK